MGVHPLGFRVGITKKHQVQWFARFHKNHYKNNVIEDRILIKTLQKQLPLLFQNQESFIPNKERLNLKTKNEKNLSVISNIKIERNLVLNEIIIKIHALNCVGLSLRDNDLFLSTISRELFNTKQDQQTRLFLSQLEQKTSNSVELPLSDKMGLIEPSPLVPVSRRDDPTLKHIRTNFPIKANKIQISPLNDSQLSLRYNRRLVRGTLRLKWPVRHNKQNHILPKGQSHKVCGNSNLVSQKLVTTFVSVLNNKFLLALKHLHKRSTTQEDIIVSSKNRLRFGSRHSLSSVIYNLERNINNFRFLRNTYLTSGKIQYNLCPEGTIPKSSPQSIQSPNKQLAFVGLSRKDNGYFSPNLPKNFESGSALGSVRLDKKYTENNLINYLTQRLKKQKETNLRYISTIQTACRKLRKIKLYSLNQKEFNTTNKQTEQYMNSLCPEGTINLVGLSLWDNAYLYKQEKALTPRIILKFYSVDPVAHKAKASVVADTVAEALIQRKSFKQVIKKQKEELMRTPGVKGVKIKVSGRLNGAEIARSEWVRAGRVPLQTIQANIDYAFQTANTIYGIIGIKVWLFK